MSKHTAGPWLYTQEGVDAFGIVKPDGHSVVHLVALHNSTSARELPANARLIAAAPDLLEALQDMVEIAEAQGHRVTKARAAITKAKGD